MGLQQDLRLPVHFAIKQRLERWNQTFVKVQGLISQDKCFRARNPANPPGSDGGGWVGSMTKGWKNGLRGLSSFRSLSWLSEVEERGSIHVSEETSKGGYKPLRGFCKEPSCGVKCFILYLRWFLWSRPLDENTWRPYLIPQKDTNVLFYYQKY